MHGETYRSPTVLSCPSAVARSEQPYWTALAALVGALVVAFLVEVVAGDAARGIALRPAADTLSVVATALFFGAGMLRYTTWRVTGDAYAAAGSAALLVLAVSGVPMALAARLMVATSTSSVPASLTRVVVVAVVSGLLAPAIGLVRLEWTPQPAWLAVLGVLGTVVVFSGAALADRSHPAFASSVGTSVGLDAGAAVVWLALAVLSLRAGREERSASARWTALAMVLLAVAGLVRAAVADSGQWAWTLSVAALMLLAGLVSLLNAGIDARDALVGQDRALHSASDALVESERLLAAVESQRSDLVHDARSMICALRAGLATLDRVGAGMDPADTHRLREAMDTELGRLNRLIDGVGPGVVEELSVAEVVAPVARTWGQQGGVVRCDLDGLRALARPDDLAHAVANLLANARAHAPDSAVSVHGDEDGGVTRIYVDDRGPGLPGDLGDGVFGRGIAAGPGAGTGLGLDVARRLVRAQGGELTATSRPGGGARFVLSLPGPQAHP